MSEQKDEKVGALWSKTSGRGEYFTGNIELTPEQVAEFAQTGKLQIVVFKNDKKTGNQPDWRILKSKPKGTAAVPTEPVTNIEDSDIAF